MHEDVVVFPRDEGFAAVKEGSREVLADGPDASDLLQKAIDACAGGGQVRLLSGVYPLRAPVFLRDGVRLCGSGRGTTLDVSAVASASAAKGKRVGIVLSKVKGASVANLRITGGDAVDANPRPGERDAEAVGVLLHKCGDCQLEGLLVERIPGYGIWIKDHAFLNRISHCSLAGNRGTQLRFENLFRGPYGDFIPNNVNDCTIYGGGPGVFFRDAILANLVGVSVYQTHGAAFHLTEGSNSVAFTGCRSYQITGDAFVCERSHELSVVGCVFCWHTGSGMILKDSFWGTVTGNEIIDNGSYNPDCTCWKHFFGDTPQRPVLVPAVKITNCHGFNVTANTIFNWGVAPPMADGILEDAASSHNTIVSNNVNYYQGEMADVLGKHSIDAHNLGCPGHPHYGDKQFYMPTTRIQSFDTSLTRGFIRDGFAAPPQVPEDVHKSRISVDDD